MSNRNQIFIIYTVFVVLVLLGVFFFTSEYIDTKKENNLLKRAVIEEQWLSNHRLEVINQYWAIPVCKESYINKTRSLNG